MLKVNKEKSILEYAYRLLALRDRSEIEMRHRLIQKSYENDEIDKTISHLKELGYIDDKKLAEKLIRFAIINKNYGRKYIKPFLLSKGIDESVINNLTISDEEFKESAESFIIKQKKIIKNKIGQGDKKQDLLCKIIKGLQSRGHDYETIKEALLNKGESNV